MWLELEAPAVEAIISMWPPGPKAFCEEVGVTESELRAWLSLKGPLGADEYERMCEMLYLGEPDGIKIILQPEGGCLLVADTEQNVACVYNSMTDFGNVAFCFEAISPTTEFHGYRVLIFLPVDGVLTLILFKKGGKAESALSRNVLRNFQGPIAVPSELALALARSTHNPALHYPGYVGSDIWTEFGNWFDALEPFSKEVSNDEEIVHLAAGVVADHWMATSGVRQMIETALAAGLGKEAIEEIVKAAYAAGFRVGAKWTED